MWIPATPRKSSTSGCEITSRRHNGAESRLSSSPRQRARARVTSMVSTWSPCWCPYYTPRQDGEFSFRPHERRALSKRAHSLSHPLALSSHVPRCPDAYDGSSVNTGWIIDPMHQPSKACTQSDSDDGNASERWGAKAQNLGCDGALGRGGGRGQRLPQGAGSSLQVCLSKFCRMQVPCGWA